MTDRLGLNGRLGAARSVLGAREREWLGFLSFLALILTLDRFTNAVPAFRPWASLVYLLAILGLGVWAGFRSALAACALLVGYVWLIYHFYPISKVVQKPEMIVTATVATAIVFPPFALLGGLVNYISRRAAVRVSDAQADAMRESEQRRVAEAELWASEDMRGLIVDSSMDAVIGIGPDRMITMWSPNAERLFGWTGAEAIGSPANVRIVSSNAGESGEDDLAALVTTQQTPVLRRQFETTAQTKLGDKLDLELYIADHKTADGAMYVVFARDISERKRSQEIIRNLNTSLEARVMERTRQLEEANEELMGFTYSVSHDLRAPLRAIVSNSRILCSDAKDRLRDDDVERLQRLENSALKLAQLIDSLLEYARIGRVALIPREVDISAVSNQIAAELKLQRDGSIVVQPGLVVNGDPLLIQMVLVNLIENAWKYVQAGETPNVEVGSTKDGAIFVRDRGVGFDMKYVDKIWEPFERLHQESEFPGTGIGLANCKRIVQRHGGTMWAESEPGVGTTVYFSIGQSKELSGAVQAKTRSHSPRASRSLPSG